MGTMIMVIKVVAAVITGFFAGHAAVFIFNRIPPEWLCDYGEEPSEELKNMSAQRIKGYPWKLVLSAVFVCGGIHLVFFDWQYWLAAVVFCWALVIISAADRKYGIIPDQFVILTALSALGFIPFYNDFMQHIYGTALGAGVMLVSALLGKLIFRRDTLGFGDVKLFAAIGLALGMKGTIFVLAASAMSSAAVFAVQLMRKKIKRDDMVPLGPYICGAAIFYVVIMCPLL